MDSVAAEGDAATVSGAAAPLSRATMTGRPTIGDGTRRVDFEVPRGSDALPVGITPTGSSATVSGDSVQLEVFLRGVQLPPPIREVLETFHQLHPEMLGQVPLYRSLLMRKGMLQTLGQTLLDYRQLKLRDLSAEVLQEFDDTAEEIKASHGVDLSWLVRRLVQCRALSATPELVAFQEAERCIHDFPGEQSALEEQIRHLSANLRRAEATFALAKVKKARAYESAADIYGARTLEVLLDDSVAEESVEIRLPITDTAFP